MTRNTVLPRVHLLTRSGNNPPVYVLTYTFTGVSAPLFMHLYGPGQGIAGPHMTVNPGLPVATPMRINPRVALVNTNVPSPGTINLSWPTTTAP